MNVYGHGPVRMRLSRKLKSNHFVCKMYLYISYITYTILCMLYVDSEAQKNYKTIRVQNKILILL